MFKRYVFSLLLFSLQYVQAQNLPRLYQQADPDKMTLWVDSVFDKMSVDQRIGQLFMIIADPSNDERTTRSIIRNIENQKIGGILFAKGDPIDQAKSTNLYQKKSPTPLLISVDGEWGLAMRLKGTPRYPKNMLLGAVANQQLLYDYGRAMALNCKEMGIHISFAPVMDVNSNPKNPVIGTRAFGEDPQLVAQRGIAYSKGLEDQGVMAVAKHFPGHGDTGEDSHKTLPVVKHNLAYLDTVDLLPFTQYIDSGFSGIMTGHLSIPALDSTTGKPSSLSPIIIQDLLQKKMGFRGLTFTDALVMKGAAVGSSSICVLALLAGNDILLSPAFPEREFAAVKKALEEGVLKQEDIEEKCMKILAYKYVLGLSDYKEIPIKGLLERLNTPEVANLIDELNAEGITVLRKKEGALPIQFEYGKKVASLSLGTANIAAFQKTLSLFTGVKHFVIPANASPKVIAAVYKQVEAYDIVLCGIHSTRISDSQQLQALAKTKKLHLVFFTNPYQLKKFKTSIAKASSVSLAYENTKSAQDAAAQVLMSGLPAKGKLPVNIDGLFELGTGLTLDKKRLAHLSPEALKYSAKDFEKIDLLVNEALKKEVFPGCQVLVAKDGVVIYNKGFGYFDFAKTHAVGIHDVYDLASITKVAATVPALMSLYDKKAFGINDHMSKHLPMLQNTNKSSISIKEALLHESGMLSFIPLYMPAIDKNSYSGPIYSSKRDLVYRVQYDTNTYMRTDFKFDSTLVSNTHKEGFDLQVAKKFYLKNQYKNIALNMVIQSTVKSKGKYLYSDLNFILLKEMVESITKKNIDAFVDENWYHALGASSLGFKPLRHIDSLQIAPTENDQFLRNQILVGFPHDEAAAFLGGVAGHAGLFSSANDLVKLLQVFLNKGSYGGKTYLTAETVDFFTSSKSAISRRGMGFDRSSETRYGHTGFTGTCFWVDPQHQLIYILLSNRVYPSRTNKSLMQMNIRSNIQEAIYEIIGAAI